VAERIIASGVEASLGERLKSARPMGGCIGEVYKVELEDGTSLVAKVDTEGDSYLEREAYMLRYLREKSDLPVPEVFHGSETLLVMEYVEGSSRFSVGAERHAAELLAELHNITADAYGHERNTLFGSLDLPNHGPKAGSSSFGSKDCCTSPTLPPGRGASRMKICVASKIWLGGWKI
jgi:fructosamine-3-kinase